MFNRKTLIAAMVMVATTLLLAACGGGGGSAPGATNAAPVAVAGGTTAGVVGSSVQLDANQSNDADGDTLSYQWQLTTKPTGSLSQLDDTGATTPTFLPDQPGTYSFSLVVNDGSIDSDPATLDVTVAAIAPQSATAELGLGRAVGQVGDTVTVPVYATTLTNLMMLEIRFQFDDTALRLVDPNDPMTLVVDAPIDPSLGSDLKLVHVTDSNGTILPNDVLFNYNYDNNFSTFPDGGTALGPETILATLEFEILTPGVHPITISAAGAFGSDLNAITCTSGTSAEVIGYEAPSTQPLAIATALPAFLISGETGAVDFTGSSLPDPVNTWIYTVVDGVQGPSVPFLSFAGLNLANAGSHSVTLGLESAGTTVESSAASLQVYQAYAGDIVLLPDAVALESALTADWSFDYTTADLAFADQTVAAELSAEQIAALGAVADADLTNDERSARLHPFYQVLESNYYLDQSNGYLYVPLTTGAASPYLNSFAGAGITAGDDAVMRMHLSQVAVTALVNILGAPPPGGGTDPNPGAPSI